ncbi:uncharacterized protein LOC111948234 [Oryzias latipes]|uniref:uncharacterized protein LOC111948234 n=1 Tax=Oryzias latipes TaxID=8090 RepID=UPI000CE23FC6|nr:uncharacterized protein LOC111948234 [Oryzias latipes]
MADEEKDTEGRTKEDGAECKTQDDDNEQSDGEETLQTSVSAESKQTAVRKSQRKRTLTEKGKSLQEAHLTDLTKEFECLYKKWKYHINCFRRFMRGKDIEIIAEAVDTIDTFQKDICNIYDSIRQIRSPDIEIRRKCDMCHTISHTAKAKAQCLLEQDGNPEDIPWPDSESVFHSSSSSTSSSMSYKSKVMSDMSKRSSSDTVQRQLAAAEVAASEEVIKIMKTQHQREEEIRELEVEDAKKRAQFLTESATIKNRLEEKRKEVELLKEMQKHNAAQARLRVYAESIKDEDEEKPLMHTHVKEDSSLLLPSFLNVHSRPFIPSKPMIPSSCHAPPQASVTQIAASSSEQVASIELVKTLAEAITANRIPIPEPAVFTGDPLQYNDWKLSFQTLVDRKNLPIHEKLFFLRKYVGGSAKKAIEGHFLVGTDTAYLAAWDTLEDRFGNPFVIGKAYRDKIQMWPKITKDSKDLREFADFLSSVESAIPYVQGLQVLNDCVENMRIAAKLPDWLSARWNRTVTKFLDEHKVFPDFSYFVKFLNKEARLACNPITSLQALKPSDIEQHHFLRDKPKRSHALNTKTLSTSTSEKPNKTCLFCKKPGHSLHKCRKLMENPVEERIKFVQSEKLCFGCLKSGHNSKSCYSRSVCDKCQKPHPTCLHQEREKRDKEQNPKTNQEALKTNQVKENVPNPREQETKQESKEVTSNRVVQQQLQGCTSSVIPVYISTKDNPQEEKLVYALLDTQSDTTFILKDTAESLNTTSEPVKLKISTITSKTKVVSSHKLNDLQVRGMNSELRVKLPTTYTRDYIPANRSHIPTNKTAENWPHLKHLSKEMAPKLDCEVGLLIGYNCPQALLPIEVISGERDQPFAQKSLLGWSIIGYSCSASDYEDEIGVSHRVIVKQVLPVIESSPEIKTQVHFVKRSKVREMIVPAEIIQALEKDFVENMAEEESMSQEDMMFLAKVKEGIRQKADGHFEMLLPFKEERPDLPNNKACAEHRLKCLERRLRKDQHYYNDYVAFMQDIIVRGDAEKVPEDEINNLPAWYIPHHGIYHPQKPNKIRVVFDASAKYQNTSLNEQLLTGPDLTNTLVGVLCRFRKGRVAIMCDVERMFHQFHVAPQDQDYFRLLWWENGNMEHPASVFRMKVHLFGAASSPGCANFGLKHLATQGASKFSQAVVKFIQRNFYVDDGLAAVDSEQEAIHLVKEARELCDTGKLHLHKFISNSKEVIATIPKEERAAGDTDLDLALGEPKMERALGVQWCVTSDTFSFKVDVKNNPFTRRGVLSTVASIFDPLGFVAPFILVGKRILQRMCQEKLGWDEPLPLDLKPQWEAWLKDLKNLPTINIPRCYITSTFKHVQQCELHSFSDASVSGYGVCSYLRTVTKTGEVQCNFIMGKARVAPTKVTTIPRLELTAAVVAVRTASFLKKELDIQGLKEYYWTDSKVVLGYINNDARRFHVFVANRIQRIRSTTEPSQWRYVASEQNPADRASRGEMTKQLAESNWFTGPSFLWQKELPQEEVEMKEINSKNPEFKVTQVFTVEAREEKSVVDRLQRISDWKRVVKAIARLKRRAKYATNHKAMSNESSTLEERKEAEEFIIRSVQKEAFDEEIKSLKQNKEVEGSHFKLHQLSPFLDEHNVLRVGGRLSQASLHPHVKHPAILPKGHHVSRLLIKHFHEKIHHQGRGMTVNEIRANGIWIISCSSEVASFIRKCVKCRKYRQNSQEQKMSDLPSERTEAMSPFTYSGMDCFGPFYVKEGRKEMKRWRKEYLLNLQQRSKWNKTRRNAKVDDIVLLQDECVPRNQWKLARVIEVIPGADGKVRRVKLLLGDSTEDKGGTRTNKTVLERPVHKTVLLLEAE